ncbi:MAG: hypothetical protein KGJ98_11940 [Chloroflexota bacterium]|nr:hypothetical protein [Chloroflexota bacterium]MDE3102933.1 hypothetical protein [Chloroflexota bacterium]
MAFLRAIRPWAIIFLVGGMLSFVATAIGGGLVEEKGIFGVRESATARTYMIGLLENEPASLISLLPQTDVVSRALQFAQSESATGQIQPISLTYIGGRTSGSLSVYLYAIEVRAGDGQDQFFPLALTLTGGRVIRRE